MSNFGTGRSGNEDLMFSMGLDGITLVDQLDSTEEKVGQSLKKIGGHFKNLKTEIENSASSNAFATKIKNTIGPVSTLATELRGLVAQLKQVNSLLTGMNTAGAPAIIKATANAAAQATVASGKAAAASIKASGQASAAAIAATGKANAAATVATSQASAIASKAASNAGAAATRAASVSSAAASKIRLSGQTLNQQFQQTGGYLRNISTVLSTIGLGGGIFALIYGFKQLVKDGIDINAQVEQAKISLAAEVVASAKLIEMDGKRVEGLQAIRAVQGQVGEIVGQLRTDALFVNGTFEDLLGIAQSITPQVTRMGGSLSQVHRLTQLTGIAASVLNVEFKTAQTGLSQLLNGNVVGRNSFVRRLPIPIDELKAGLKDVNGRAEFLIKTLARLEDAGPLIMTSFKGALESMKDLLQQVSGRAFEPLQKRLQGSFNSFITNNVLKSGDGTMKYSTELEATISRVSRLVDILLAQMVMLARQLSDNGNRSFLDVAEETLPKIVAGLGNLLTVLGSVGGFLTDHAGLVLKLLGYYMSFNLAVGVFNSLGGVANKLKGIFAVMQSLWVTLGGGVTNLSGAVAVLTTGLQALATKTIIGLVLVAVMELVSGFMDASHAAKDMKLAADDINKLNFDTAIGQIRKMVQELREGDNMWTRFWFSATHGGSRTRLSGEAIDKLTGSAVNQSLGILDKLGVTSNLPRNNFGGLENRPAVLANFGNLTGQGIEALRAQQAKLETEARTASDKRRDGIRQELAQNAQQQEALRQTLSLLKENVLAEEALKKAAAPGSPEQTQANRVLSNSDISLYAAAGRTVPAVEVGLNMAPRTKVTPNTSVTPPDEEAARRILRNESALLSALEQVSQSAARVLDRNNQRQQDEMDLLVAKHVLTVQQAAAREIQIAKDTAAAKIGVQQDLFKKLADNKLVDLSGAKEALGLGTGSLTFAELRGVSEADVAQALANMQGKADTGNKTEQAKFQKQIHDLEALGKIVATIHSEEERLGGSIAEQSRRIERANEDAVNSGKEQSDQMAERAAQLDAEQEKLFDLAVSLDERLEREKLITSEIVKQGKADVDRKSQKQINDNNEKTNWTPEQKSAANAVITANANREKNFLAAKEEIALAQRIIEIKDQEIELGQTGTDIREIELNTLKRILGAENPLVMRKQNELIVEKAKTLELKAQARYAAATDLRNKGQNTAAREAEKQGDILMAQAGAMHQETANFLQMLSGGMGELSTLLGKFSGSAGAISTDIGQMLGGIGKIQKVGGLGGLFNAGKGTSTGAAGTAKGVMAVAGPLMSVASSVVGILSVFANGSTEKAIAKIDKAATKFSESISNIVDGLRNHTTSLKDTIAQLEYQRTQVSVAIPHERVSWLSSLFGGAGKADAERESKIAEATKAIDDQLKALKQDAQSALRTLMEETLPALRVTPAMREFEASLVKIRTELKELAGNPDVTQEAMNELFNIRLADLQVSAMETLAGQRQEYLDILKQEKSLQEQLGDLDNEKVQAETDYKNQRAQILGLASRELSKSEQLAKLKDDQKQKLDDIEKRRLALQTELDYVEKQKAVYAEIMGAVTDIGAYEMSIQDELLGKTKERLGALQTFLQEIQAWVASGVLNFTAGVNTYVPPTPNPSDSPSWDAGSQTNYNMNGDIYVSGNMTQSQAKEAFLAAWRSFNQDNAARGLAHSNA